MTLLATLSTDPVRRRWRERAGSWSPGRDRAWFFGFFLLGVAAILTLKELVDHQGVVTGVPCALMLLYAGRLWNFGEARPRSDAAGDNLYYLGFLYTLTSLAHSLYRFSASEADTEIIVTNFGIAISTTILGMALRILLGRPAVDDPAAIEESARLDLARTARKLRAEMSYTVDTFRERLEEDLEGFRGGVGTFRELLAQDLGSLRERLAQDADDTHAVASKTVEHMQSLQRGVELIDDGMGKAAAGLAARAEELQRSASQLTAFEEAVRRLDSRANALVEAMERHSTGLIGGAGEIREALREQAEHIRDVDFRQALHDAVEPASTHLQAAVDRTAAQVDARIDSVFRSLEERSERLATVSDAVRESLREQAERIGDVDFRQAFLDHAVDPASNELRAAAVEFKALLEGLRHADAMRQRALGSSEQVTAALLEALRRQHDLAGSVAETLHGSREIADSLRTAGERLSRFSHDALDAARRIADVRDGLSQSAARIHGVNEELMRASAALATGIRDAERVHRVRPRRRWFTWFRSSRPRPKGWTLRRWRRARAASTPAAGGGDRSTRPRDSGTSTLQGRR